MLRIKAFPRIHISLIGMNYDGYRLNGGIGFSMEAPTLDMCFEPSDSVEIIDQRKTGFTHNELDKLKLYFRDVVNKEQFGNGIQCVIQDGMIQSHVGLGSSSMAYISCAEALLILNHRDYTADDVIGLSGRGGTSGIGIHAYFMGGFIFDTGVVNLKQKPLAPSSSFVGQIVHKPLLLKQFKLPKWDLGVCIPPIGHKSEDEERAFFQDNCPIEKDAAEKILYESVYGVTSSLMENDFQVFCKSINAIQHTKWKMLERSLYGDDLFKVEATIKDEGAECVGMSSLGPMLYFFGKDVGRIVDRINQKMPNGICFKTSFNNSSRIIEND